MYHRGNEYEDEVINVRDIVMVLAKAIGQQPKGQELPGHEDPVWAKLGPLGGVQHALEVAIKHIRVSITAATAGQAAVNKLATLQPVVWCGTETVSGEANPQQVMWPCRLCCS